MTSRNVGWLRRVLYERVETAPTAPGRFFVSAKFFPLRVGEPLRRYPPCQRPAGRRGPPGAPERALGGLWGHGGADYLACGRADMAAMLDILRAGGARPEELFRVLEFGRAAGRMLRFYPCTGDKSEIWSVDIKARYIVWCQQHLAPRFRCATTRRRRASPSKTMGSGLFSQRSCR